MARPKLDPTADSYAGRAPDIRIVNLSLPRDCLEIVRRHAPTRKGYSALVARALYEFDARRQAQAELRARVLEALDGTEP
jgi:hypothetical protein